MYGYNYAQKYFIFYQFTIITYFLSVHHYHLFFISSPLSLIFYQFTIITYFLSVHHYHLFFISSPLSLIFYQFTIITYFLSVHHYRSRFHIFSFTPLNSPNPHYLSHKKFGAPSSKGKMCIDEAFSCCVL